MDVHMVASGCFRWSLIVAAILSVSAYSGQPLAQTTGDAVSGDTAAVNDETAIRGVSASYNNAVNGGKTAAVVPLYADDGVFMPPYNPSPVGKDAMRKAYDAVFDELNLHATFTIAHLVVMAATWAYAMKSGGSLAMASGRPIHPPSKPGGNAPRLDASDPATYWPTGHRVSLESPQDFSGSPQF